MASIYNNISSLLKGGSESYLIDRVGAIFWRYLKDNNLISATNGIASCVVLNGCTLEVEQEGDSIIAEGILDGLIQRIELASHQYLRYHVDLQKFLFLALGLSSLMKENELTTKRITLLSGSSAYKVIHLTAYGCTVYWCPNNSDSEFSAVERDNDGILSNKIVILTPRSTVPKSFQTKIGNTQHIDLKQLIDESDGDIDITPLTNLIKGAKQQQNVYPYYIHPKLQPDEFVWEDFSLEIRRGDVALSYNGKHELYAHYKLHFSRPPQGEAKSLRLPLYFLLLLGAGYRCKSLKLDKHRQMLRRINQELQTFFRQSERFYEKGEDGSYHPRLNISVEATYLSELEETWAQSVKNDIESSDNSGLRKAMVKSNLAKRTSSRKTFDE